MANTRFSTCCYCSCVTKDDRAKARMYFQWTISLRACVGAVDRRWTQGSVLAPRPEKSNAERNKTRLRKDKWTGLERFSYVWSTLRASWVLFAISRR